jgi:hypothetical protein
MEGVKVQFDLQALPSLRNTYVPVDTAKLELLCASRTWLCMWSNTVYICIRGTTEFSWNPDSSTLEPDRPQLGRTAICIIAQEYSSAVFVSLRCLSHKEKFGACFKNVTISIFFYFFKNYSSLKLRDLKVSCSVMECLTIYAEGLRKTTETFSRDSWSPGQDLNPDPPEHGMPTAVPQFICFIPHHSLSAAGTVMKHESERTWKQAFVAY